MTSQLEKLKIKEAQLKARIQMLEAGEKTKERKKDMQRKILFGSFMLQRVKENDPIALELQAKLSGYLTRDHDRALFDLPPLPKEDNAEAVKRAEVEAA